MVLINVPKTVLREQYDDCRRRGELTNLFASTALEIARARLAQQRPAMQQADRDAVLSAYCYRLVKIWARIDPAKNIHSYLIQMCNYALMDHERRRSRRHRRQIPTADINQLDNDNQTALSCHRLRPD